MSDFRGAERGPVGFIASIIKITSSRGGTGEVART